MAGLIALLLWFGGRMAPAVLGPAFLALWTLYAFVSGVVAVPYNDIVGRAIPSGSRSRMLAWRFFGGGVFALGVAAFVRLTLDSLPNLQAYALIFGLAALLLILSSTLFVSAGEPPAGRETGRKAPQDARALLRGGWHVLKTDSRFRLFLQSQWLGGATLMALPFYVIAADASGVTSADVGVLLGAQTAARSPPTRSGAGSVTARARSGCCRLSRSCGWCRRCSSCCSWGLRPGSLATGRFLW